MKISNLWEHVHSTILGWAGGIVYAIGTSAGCATDLRNIKVWGPAAAMAVYGSLIGPAKKPPAA